MEPRPGSVNNPNWSQNWDLWKADWKYWWGNTIGYDSWKNDGLAQRNKILGKQRPGSTYEDSFENDPKSMGQGVTGNKVPDAPVGSTFMYPTWKYPAFERNKYDDELLKKAKEQPIGSGKQ